MKFRDITLPLVPMHTKEELARAQLPVMEESVEEGSPFDTQGEQSAHPAPPFSKPLRRSDRVRRAPVWMQDYVGSIESICIPLSLNLVLHLHFLITFFLGFVLIM